MKELKLTHHLPMSLYISMVPVLWTICSKILDSTEIDRNLSTKWVNNKDTKLLSLLDSIDIDTNIGTKVLHNEHAKLLSLYKGRFI